MPSFSIPLTGLESDSTALNTIANNLSNLNTTAFKAQHTSFSDLFYQQIGSTGSGNPNQIGAGTKVATTSTDFAQGGLSNTGNATDVALNGNGFFVLKNNGTTEYTRDGSFSLDPNGNLVTASGLQVMGYPATGGVINTNAPLTPINIPLTQVQQPASTKNLSISANLDASASTGAVVTAPVNLYDSLGVSHTATITFTKAGSNSWNYSLDLPAGDYTGSPKPATGTLTFDSAGNLTAPASPVTGISFAGLTDGASNLSFNWNLTGSTSQPSITQVAATSAVSSTSQDGYSSGQYQSFTIGSDGAITVSFSNGQKSAVGQLAVASITNPQGLVRSGGNDYQTTLASGQASVAQAGAGGRGTLQDAALEQSNVDISTEFSDLIVAQRAFEANSKAITTFDTVTQETINMIH